MYTSSILAEVSVYKSTLETILVLNYYFVVLKTSYWIFLNLTSYLKLTIYILLLHIVLFT